MPGFVVFEVREQRKAHVVSMGSLVVIFYRSATTVTVTPDNAEADRVLPESV
jgi:hypothetical protein